MIERAQHRRTTSGERTIFFLDEIHRFNKAQQDTLLPAVEDGPPCWWAPRPRTRTSR